jgi:hypothetical protein
MLHQLRTVGAGIAVLALCFLLASSSWQFLLLGFAIASIAWAIWSWSAQLRPEQPAPPKPLQFEQRTRRGRRTVAREVPSPNLYSFPQEWDHMQGTSY